MTGLFSLLYVVANSESQEDQIMSKRPRRNHAPQFKAKVALDALKGEQTIIALSERYGICQASCRIFLMPPQQNYLSFSPLPVDLTKLPE